MKIFNQLRRLVMIRKDTDITGFNESEYLAANPDVAASVERGNHKSGFQHYQLHGKREGRPLKKEKTREEKIFHMLDKKGLGLEIGPSHAPIASKKKGFNVQTIDHLDASGLRMKYQNDPNVNIDNIEEVDFVWNGEPYSELIGKSECYDWIIASHLIEHVPDFLFFLKQCETMLKPSGFLSLAIPDRRYCFDYFNTITMTGHVLDAWHGKSTRPTPGQVFDGFANQSSNNEAFAWGPGQGGATRQGEGKFADAKNRYLRALASNDYIDTHCWRFTPASFRLLISDLQALELLSLGIVCEFEPFGCEFLATLAKGKIMPEINRFDALQKILFEGQPESFSQ